MKVKKLNFIIPLAIYPFDIMFSFNQNYDEFGKSVINKWPPTILEDFKKYEHPNGKGLTYIYVSETHLCCMVKIDYFNINKDHGILAHEIFHACEFILRKCGFELNSNSHEAYAYLIGYVTQEVYKKL